MFPYKIGLLLPVTLGTDASHLQISAETSILLYHLLKSEELETKQLPRLTALLPGQREKSPGGRGLPIWPPTRSCLLWGYVYW